VLLPGARSRVAGVVLMGVKLEEKRGELDGLRQQVSVYRIRICLTP
jgi:hypothetical protein